MKIEANLKKLYQLGLFSESRKHELGVNSNRLLERDGEYFLKSCTYRPSQSENLYYLKINIIQLTF